MQYINALAYSPRILLKKHADYTQVLRSKLNLTVAYNPAL